MWLNEREGNTNEWNERMNVTEWAKEIQKRKEENTEGKNVKRTNEEKDEHEGEM
jgi:hypothetical protein